ncbi:MAG: ABC transporter permease [Candidatus Rokubacteria bacterium]|nr:ABC transporter permease [Candidatus Rokubacteria bacterium]
MPVLFLAALFVYPVARLMLFSVEGGSLKHFERALLDGLHVRVFIDTLRIASLVTLLSFLLGYPVAYFLASAPRAWATAGLLFLIVPFWTSVLIRTYAWTVVLGRNGVINRSLIGLGVIEEPIAMLNNEIGVLVGMVHVLVPYMVFPIFSVMRRIDPSLAQAAEGLGASGWQSFSRVYFPLSLPGVLAGTTLVFILSVGFFITPAILGGGRVIMIAVLIERQVHEFSNWGFAAALSAVLLAASLAAYGALSLALRDRR